MRNKKKLNKIIIFYVLILSFLILSPQALLAGNPKPMQPPKQEVSIPGLDLKPVTCTRNSSSGGYDCSINWLSEYISAVYDYALLIGGILAAIMIMAGGLIWLTSGGDATKVGSAKKLLTGSITGLVLLFSSFLILNIINPELVKKKDLTMKGPVDSTFTSDSNISCCEYKMYYPVKGQGEGKHETYCETFTTNSDSCPSALTEPNLTQGLIQEYKGVSCTKPGRIPLGEKCVTAPDIESSSNEWLFQGNIAQQVPDASQDLRMLISCIRKKVPASVGVISSISDNLHLHKLGECNVENCAKGTKGQEKCGDVNCCVHACQSCHYGGGKKGSDGKLINKSYAVDFGDEENATVLINAAYSCDPGGYYALEGDHVHMSVSACPKN